MSYAASFNALAAAGLIVATDSALAHWSCVSTSAQLQQALSDASDGGIYNGEDNTVAVAQGTYATGAATSNGPFRYHSGAPHSLVLEGGYSTNCVTLAHKAALSVLDGQHLTAVLSLQSRNGDVFVDWLTLQNGEGTEPGAGLQVNYNAVGSGQISINDNIIRHNHTTAGAGGLYVSAQSDFVYDNLIAGNSANGPFGAGYVTNHGQGSEVMQNTVTDNASTVTAGSLYCGGVGICYVKNNIIWHNADVGLYLGAPGAVLEYNDIGSRGGFAPSAALSFHNVSVAPAFIDPAHGDFHLGAGSPLLDFAPTGPFPQVDLDGNVFTFLTADLGAYQRMP